MTARLAYGLGHRHGLGNYGALCGAPPWVYRTMAWTDPDVAEAYRRGVGDGLADRLARPA